MIAPSHMIASIDAALAEYTAGIDRAVSFVTIDQVDMLAEFYLHNRRTPDPAQIRADALQELCDDLLHLGDDLTYFPALADHNLHIKAYDIRSRLFALIDAPLSPPAVDNSPAPDAGGNVDPAVYLIRKYGGYYRPNCQGYTRFKEEAGRYTLAKAISESHPNGPDGPRDGMTYIHEDDVLPLDAGGKEGV